MVPTTQDVEIKLCFFFLSSKQSASSSLKYESYDVSLGVRMWHIAVRFTYHVNEDTPVLQGLELWSFLCFIECRHSLTRANVQIKIQGFKCGEGRVSVSGGRGPTKAFIHGGHFWFASKPHTLLFLATVAPAAPPGFAQQTLER